MTEKWFYYNSLRRLRKIEFLKIFSLRINGTKLHSAICKVIANRILKKIELAELIMTKYPSFKAIIDTGINQIFYLLGLSWGFKLTTIVFELTNRCNLNCIMCPVNRDMRRKKGFMDVKLFKKIIDENPQLYCTVLYFRGKSLLHPNFFDMVNYGAYFGYYPCLQ